MLTALRSLRLLSIVLWVGGIAFFAFGVAPVAFATLPSAHEAGLLVGGSIRVLHWIGLVAGPVFLLVTAALWLLGGVHGRLAPLAGMVLVLLMLAGTASSQFGILPSMERDRQRADGRIDQLDLSDPARVDFDRLHRLSEKIEGAVLLCGLALVVLLAREPNLPRPTTR